MVNGIIKLRETKEMKFKFQKLNICILFGKKCARLKEITKFKVYDLGRNAHDDRDWGEFQQ